MHKVEKIYWSPWECLLNAQDEKYAIIVLNTPITSAFHTRFLLKLWNKATVRMTVDGGTNEWFSWLKRNGYDNNNKVFPPDMITGDFDSVSKEILHHFVRNSALTQVIQTPDQNETDFTKALKELDKYTQHRNIKLETVYTIVDTAGRFDQIMANINTLYKIKEKIPYFKVFLLASDSLTWLLKEGQHSIAIPANLRQNKEWCGLIPLGSSCQVTTTGLKWNLNKNILEFGGIVSTSNTYGGDSTVNIQSDNPLVWTMGIKTLV